MKFSYSYESNDTISKRTLTQHIFIWILTQHTLHYFYSRMPCNICVLYFYLIIFSLFKVFSSFILLNSLMCIGLLIKSKRNAVFNNTRKLFVSQKNWKSLFRNLISFQNILLSLHKKNKLVLIYCSDFLLSFFFS